MSLKIHPFGNEYWFLGDSLDEDAAIAPLDHCDDIGHIKDFEVALCDMSFAHYFPGEGIYRYGEKIGERADIELMT